MMKIMVMAMFKVVTMTIIRVLLMGSLWNLSPEYLITFVQSLPSGQ